MTPAEIDQLQDERLTAVGLVFEVAQALENGMSTQLAEHGLSNVEAGVVLRLARSPEHRLRMSDLALQCDLSASGLTRVVDRLVRAGLVRRTACDTDRRVTYAVLTDDGVARALALIPGHLERIDELLLRHLDDDQLESMLDALRVVRDAIRPNSVAGVQDAAPTRA